MPLDTTKTDEDLYPSRVGGEPGWLERLDPVIYSNWNESAPLSREQHAGFERDGFLILNDVFGQEEIALIQDELDRLRADSTDLDQEATIREPHGRTIRSIFGAHQQSGLFHRLACDHRITDIARYILNDDVVVHQSRLNYKPGFHGKDFFWHSDFETWHVEDGMPRMRAVSISILLTDNDQLNGPLLLVPGSHRHFLSCEGRTPRDNYRASLKRQDLGVPDDAMLSELIGRRGITPATGPAGTVVIFDCNTLHGSNSNITPAPRANAFFVYNAVSNALRRPYGAPAPRPEFLAGRTLTQAVQPAHGAIRPMSA